MPTSNVNGDWIEPTGKGRTFYVGVRENGKLLRVYEKGKQLGEKDSPWVRWEVELHNEDRVIPWDVLIAPGRYVAGSYPALSWVQADVCRIKTLRKTDGITYDRLVRHARQSVGKLVHTMVEREGSAEAAVALVRREGTPERLKLTERLGLRGRKARMNFEGDDFDWALGELLALIWRGKLAGIPAHLLEPRLFHDCMRVINAQPFEDRQWAHQVITGMEPFRFLRAKEALRR